MELKELCEALKRRKVIRKGKMKIKYQTDRDGYKVKYDPKTGQAKEVRMSPAEIRKRMISSRKSRAKRKAKSGQTSRRRAISMRRRKSW